MANGNGQPNRDNLQKVHGYISRNNPDFKVDFDTFVEDMQDLDKLQKVHGWLQQNNPDFKVEAPQFAIDMGIGPKKKEDSGLAPTETAVEEPPTPPPDQMGPPEFQPVLPPETGGADLSPGGPAPSGPDGTIVEGTEQSLETELPEGVTTAPAESEQESAQLEQVSAGLNEAMNLSEETGGFPIKGKHVTGALSQINRGAWGIIPDVLDFLGQADYAIQTGLEKIGVGEAQEGADKTLMGRAAKYVRDKLEGLTPVEKEFQESTTGQVFQGIGQVMGLIGSAGPQTVKAGIQATKAAGSIGKEIARTLIKNTTSRTSQIASMQMASHGYRNAKQAGASDKEAFLKWLADFGIGKTEALPIGAALDRFNKITKGGLGKRILNTAQGTLEETVQESMQEYLSNLAEQNIYNEGKNLLDNVTQSGKVGGLTGFFINALLNALPGNTVSKRKLRKYAEEMLVKHEQHNEKLADEAGEIIEQKAKDNASKIREDQKQADQTRVIDEASKEPGRPDREQPTEESGTTPGEVPQTEEVVTETPKDREPKPFRSRTTEAATMPTTEQVEKAEAEANILIDKYDKDFAEKYTGKKNLSYDEVTDVVAEAIQKGEYIEPTELYAQRDKLFNQQIDYLNETVTEALKKNNISEEGINNVLEAFKIKKINKAHIQQEGLDILTKKLKSDPEQFSKNLQQTILEDIYEANNLDYELATGPDSGLSDQQKLKFAEQANTAATEVMTAFTDAVQLSAATKPAPAEQTKVLEKPKTPGLQVGITPATEKIPEIAEKLTRLREAEQKQDFEAVEQINNEILDFGEQKLQDGFKDIPGVEVKINRTAGSFIGQAQPTFITDIDGDIDANREAIDKAMVRQAAEWKQDNVHLRRKTDTDPASVEMGTVQEDGSTYEPGLEIEFDKALTNEQKSTIAKAANEAGLAGFTWGKDNKSLDLYNVTQLNPLENYEQQITELQKALDEQGILGQPNYYVQQLWNYGEKQNGATRGFQEVDSELSQQPTEEVTPEAPPTEETPTPEAERPPPTERRFDKDKYNDLPQDKYGEQKEKAKAKEFQVVKSEKTAKDLGLETEGPFKVFDEDVKQIKHQGETVGFIGATQISFAATGGDKMYTVFDANGNEITRSEDKRFYALSKLYDRLAEQEEAGELQAEVTPEAEQEVTDEAQRDKDNETHRKVVEQLKIKPEAEPIVKDFDDRREFRYNMGDDTHVTISIPKGKTGNLIATGSKIVEDTRVKEPAATKQPTEQKAPPKKEAPEKKGPMQLKPSRVGKQITFHRPHPNLPKKTIFTKRILREDDTGYYITINDGRMYLSETPQGTIKVDHFVSNQDLKKQAKIEADRKKHNRIVEIVNQYNQSNKRERAKMTNEKNEAKRLARGLNYRFEDTGRGANIQVYVPKKRGTGEYPIKAWGERGVVEETNQILTDYDQEFQDEINPLLDELLRVYQESDHNIFGDVEGVRAKKQHIPGIVNDIRTGKRTDRAAWLLEDLARLRREGRVGFTQGSGVMQFPTHNVPWSEFVQDMQPKKRLTPKEWDAIFKKNPALAEAIMDFQDENGNFDYEKALDVIINDRGQLLVVFDLSDADINLLEDYARQKAEEIQGLEQGGKTKGRKGGFRDSRGDLEGPTPEVPFQRFIGQQRKGQRATAQFLRFAFRRLAKAVPGLKYHYDQKTFDDRLALEKEKGAQFKGNTRAFVGTNGEIYLNPERVNRDTPVHEVGHMWVDAMLRSKDPRHRAMIKQGLELIKGTSYYRNAKAAKYPNPEMEALVEAIGRRGEDIINRQQRSAVKTWLQDFWTTIKKALGIRPKFQIDEMTIDEIINMGARQITGGVPIVKTISRRQVEEQRDIPTLAETKAYIEANKNIPLESLVPDFAEATGMTEAEALTYLQTANAEPTPRKYRTRTKAQKKIDELTGNIRQKNKITIQDDEYTMLKQRMKTLERGARMARNDLLDIAKEMRQYIRDHMPRDLINADPIRKQQLISINKAISEAGVSKANLKKAMDLIDAVVVDKRKRVTRREIDKLFAKNKPKKENNVVKDKRLASRQADVLTTSQILWKNDGKKAANKIKQIDAMLESGLLTGDQETLLRAQKRALEFADNREMADLERGEMMKRPLEEWSDQDWLTYDLLSMVGSPDLDLGNLTEAHNNLAEVVETGRTFRQAQQALKSAEIGQQIDRVLDELTGQGTKTIATEAERQKQKNFWDRFADTMTSLRVTMESMPTLMEFMNRFNKNGGTFEGALHNIVNSITDQSIRSKRNVNKAMEGVINKATEIYGKDYTKHFEKNGKEQDVTLTVNGKPRAHKMSKAEAYHYWQVWQQGLKNEDESILGTFDKMGWDYKTIEDIENFLTDNGKDERILEWAEWQMNEFYPYYYPRINQVYQKQFGINLPFIENYVPTFRKPGKGEQDVDLFKNSQEYGASMVSGSLKSRVPNFQEFRKLSGDDLILQHIAKMEHFIAMSEVVNDAKRLFNDAAVRDAITQLNTRTAMKVIDSKLDEIIRDSVNPSMSKPLVDKVRANFITAKIGLSVPVFVKQLTSIPGYMAGLRANQTPEFMLHMAEFWTNPVKNWNELIRKSDYLTNRYHDNTFNRDLAELSRQVEGKLGGRKSMKLREFFLLMTKLGDRAAIVLGGWPMYKTKVNEYKKKGLDTRTAERKALKDFERWTRMTQQSGERMDLSSLQSSGSLGNLFTMFQNSPLQYWRMEMAALTNLVKGRGNQADNVKNFILFHFVLPGMFQAASSAFTGSDDEDWIRTFALGSLAYTFIAGDIVEHIYDKMAKGRAWDVSFLPGSLMNDLSKNVDEISKLISKGVEDMTVDEMFKSARNATAFIENMIGMPINQVIKYAEAGHDIATGRTSNYLRLAGFSDYALGDMHLSNPVTGFVHRHVKKGSNFKEMDAEAKTFFGGKYDSKQGELDRKWDVYSRYGFSDPTVNLIMDPGVTNKKKAKHLVDLQKEMGASDFNKWFKEATKLNLITENLEDQYYKQLDE